MDKNLIKIGDIALFENAGDMFGNAIEKVQYRAGLAPEAARYVHIAACGGEYDLVDPVFPRIRRRKNGLAEYMKAGRGFIVLRPRWQIDEQRYKRGFIWASMCNIRYGWPNLLWFVMPRWYREKFHLLRAGKFCSQLVAEGLKLNRELLWVTAKKPEECFPGDFYNLRVFEPVAGFPARG